MAVAALSWKQIVASFLALLLVPVSFGFSSSGNLKRDIEVPNALNLLITKNQTVEIPSTLYGFMWEDINHCGDGGLYAELLQNRAFQKVTPGTSAALNAWKPFNGAALSVTANTPGVSAALPNSLQVQIPGVISGPVGFVNTGFWGMKVQEGWTYNGSFYVKSDTFKGSITVALKSARGTTYASKTVSGVTKDWKKITFQLQPSSSAPDAKNVFSVSIDGGSANGQTIYFGMFSLFPPTWKGRENGMRIDLADALVAANPGVWRFPGGNNVEGGSFAERWRWNETLGPVENRPGRIGDWNYVNTDGLGLVEYLNWAEDIGAEPILGVWSGISLGNFSDFPDWPIVPEAGLQPYIDDVINEIDFITADARTNEFGKLRASLGREEPWQLRYVEIGNEDMFQADSYAAYRWNAFVSVLGEKFPDLKFIATTLPSTALNPPYTTIDFHQYNSPSWFYNNAFFFDTYPRNGTKWFIGEYAVTSTNDSNNLGELNQGRLAFPTLQGALAEAAFLTGIERNSDVVFASSYAPTLQHIDSYAWTPELITFNAESLILSISYYAHQMFSTNKGSHVLATSPPSTNASFPLFWVASRNNETNVVYLKVVNVGDNDLVGYLNFDFTVSSTFLTAVALNTAILTPIFGLVNISNTFENPELLVPTVNSMAMPFTDRYNYTFPASSITVLSFQVDDW